MCVHLILNEYMYVYACAHTTPIHPRVSGCMCVPCAKVSACAHVRDWCQTKSLELGSAGRVSLRHFSCVRKVRPPLSGSSPRENKPAELLGAEQRGLSGAEGRGSEALSREALQGRQSNDTL